MPSKAFQTLVIGLGAGVGLYFGQAGLQIARVTREEQRLRKKVALDEKAAQTSEAQQHVEETAVAKLQEQLQLQRQDLQSLEADLTVARQRVTELEGLHASQAKAALETEGAIQEAQGRMGRLAEEMRRHREAAAVAQQALSATHIRLEEKQRLSNPLNHPLVRGMFK